MNAADLPPAFINTGATPLAALPLPRVEEKLFQNRYRVDVGNPHIRIKDEATCARCLSTPCVVCCPASCWNKSSDGRIELVVDGCLECGTCRIVCEPGNVDWNYPRGGYGILFKFG